MAFALAEAVITELRKEQVYVALGIAQEMRVPDQ